MCKKIKKPKITFMLFSITVFIVLYNLYRKNSQKEFGQPLVKLQLPKKGQSFDDGVSQEEEGDQERDGDVVAEAEAAEDEEENGENHDFGIDGDIKAAVDNMGNRKKKKQLLSGKIAGDDTDNGGEFYN